MPVCIDEVVTWMCQVTDINRLVYATADEADAYMFYTCFFPSVTKIPDYHSQEQLNGFS